MNSVELFFEQSYKHPKKMAIWIPGQGAVSFAELRQSGIAARNLFQKQGMVAGDYLVLADQLSPRVYAAIIGALSLGACVVFIEPWMSPSKINEILEKLRPRHIATGFLTRLFLLRASGLRQIPVRHWLSGFGANKQPEQPFAPNQVDNPQWDAHVQLNAHVQQVNNTSPAILTFTSGTTGQPKGVLRQHEYLLHQHQVIEKNLEHGDGADICIFANFALLNLASGRSTILIPSHWKNLRKINQSEIEPSSLTCGPAFLRQLMLENPVSSLRHIHVGGALTDTKLFEAAFKQWPHTYFTHVYGSSEAEPVCLTDAKKAVEHSKNRNLFQTLFIGKPVKEISYEIAADTLWVTGAHVCKMYWGTTPENDINKKQKLGEIWHNMGDRISEDQLGWWYSGRSSQTNEHFKYEQAVYWIRQDSTCFLVPVAGSSSIGGEYYLCGENSQLRKKEFEKILPLKDTIEMKILRDARHRSRIDRNLSLKKGAPWLIG